MSWDLFSKALIKECSQDFVTYFAPDALYLGMREAQLQTRTDGLFDPREMRGDGIIEAECEGSPFLIDVEWQSTRDDEMDERLLGYSYEATRLHGLPVLSAVIYTQSVSGVPRAPLVRSIPGKRVRGGSPALWFDFVSLEVCRQPVEAFRALNLDAFAVLMLLCKDGGTTAILEEVLERLLQRKEKRRESIAAAIFFAGKVFTSEKDLQFLERKRGMLQDTLRESWTYQQVLKEGRAEGREEGRVEGREEGRAEGREEGRVEGREEGREQEVRRTIALLCERFFPTMLAWAQERVEQIGDLQILYEIESVLFKANTEEEVRQAFSPVRQEKLNTIH